MTHVIMKPDLPNNNLAGLFWAFLGVGLFGFIYITGRLSGGDISAGQLIWFRYVGALITIVLWIMIFPSERRKVRSRQVPVHGLRAIAGGGGGMAAIYAASHMSVTSATAIGLLDGLFVIIFGVVLLGERFSARQWAAAALCLLGAAVVVFTSGAATVQIKDMLPASVALLGAILVATESILIKKLARSEASISVLFYVSLFGTILFSIPAVASWKPLDPVATGLLLLLGPIALAGQLCNIFAFRQSDAALIGPIRYTWIIWGALFGWLFFGEVPLAVSWGGMLFIFCGGCYLAFSRNR
ncbi:DMT family transporter [Tritonibacter mobilis]|uniref:DMT family transporter n=1 Tax=Tritonibacter mobilis TaxID=379347 RepID=UPI00398FD4B5